MKAAAAKPFCIAVEDLGDSVDDDYYNDINRPIDLTTIAERLSHGVYRKIGE